LNKKLQVPRPLKILASGTFKFPQISYKISVLYPKMSFSESD